MFTEVGGEKRERKQAVLKSVTDSCKLWRLLKPLLHWGWLGLGTAVSPKHAVSPPCLSYLWLHVAKLVTGKKKIKGEQEQVIAQMQRGTTVGICCL